MTRVLADSETEPIVRHQQNPAENLISVLKIHLGHLEAVQQSRSSGLSSLLLSAGSLGLDEVAAQPWKLFQQK